MYVLPGPIRFLESGTRSLQTSHRCLAGLRIVSWRTRLRAECPAGTESLVCSLLISIRCCPLRYRRAPRTRYYFPIALKQTGCFLQGNSSAYAYGDPSESRQHYSPRARALLQQQRTVRHHTTARAQRYTNGDDHISSAAWTDSLILSAQRRLETRHS